ncbi:MAG: zinc-ribbon domain-containing protein, partial [Candidatus Acidiferrales bacterium]
MKYCHRCGVEVAEAHQFCPQCGQNLQAPPSPPAQPAIRDYGRHVRILAVLLLVWGGLGLLRGVGMMFIAGPMGSFLRDVVGYDLPGRFLPHLIMSLGWVFLAVAVATVAAGVGLMNYEPW